MLIRESYRRSISMTLQASGQLRIKCPKTCSRELIHSFLEKHSAWIESNLRAYQEVRDQNPQKRYETGEEFMFMGRQLRLVLMLGGSRGGASATEDHLVVYVPPRLTGAHLSEARKLFVRKQVLDFYQRQGRRVLGERLHIFSEQMGLFPRAVSYRSQKTRWGSCSSRQKISLNWRLIFAPMEVIDYVVIHELSHLRHYDHSVAFWSLVSKYSPRYREQKRWLRDRPYAADFLAKNSELYP